MADDIIQFAVGGKVTAEETNENNLLLREWALDNSKSEQYIDTKINQLDNNIDTKIASINTQLAQCVKTSGNQTVNGAKIFQALAAAGTPITTVAMSKGAIGYVQMGNGLIIQWEKREVSSGKVSAKAIYERTWSFPKKFTNNNVIALSVVNGQVFCGSTISTNATAAKFHYKNTNTSDSSSFTYVFSIAIGY